VTVYRWVQTFTSEFIDSARPARHAAGDRWFVDETYVKVAGRWTYLYRGIDQHGQVVDVMLSIQRDLAAARAFFVKALKVGTVPLEVSTDRAASYPRVLDELLPQALHTVQQYSNNPVEADHGRLKARLRPMRGLKRHRSVRTVAAGHAFVQNLRRGHYDIATERPSTNGSSLPSASLPSASEPDPTAARISHLAATKSQRNSALAVAFPPGRPRRHTEAMAGDPWHELARGGRSALIVASDKYQDPGFSELRAPAADADALAAVLSDPEIGGFDVRTLLNEPTHVVTEAVEEFLTDRSPDDLLLLHFSCHGIKDQEGELYFAMANTRLRLLGATAVAADFVNRRMTQSRSRRIVLFLDCCYAGAFDRGMRARATKVMDLEERFGGRGRAVITASGAVEYAFEGDRLTESGDPAPSVFTTAMVRGLTTGEADRDQDGYVDLDELYDYVYDAVREVTPHQTPGKWTFGVQGDLVIARRSTPVTEPAVLPPELQHSIDSPLAGVRAGAVDELARLLSGRHQGLALAARRALETLTDDDSRTVVAAATAALGGSPVGSPNTAPTEATGPAPPTGPTGTAATTGPTRRPPTVVTPGHSREPTTPRTRPRRRLWPASNRARVILTALAAAVLLVGGAVTWRVLGQAGHSTTIPASFDGAWLGRGPDGAEFTATLGKDLHLGRLASGASSCYGGLLTVRDATDSQLTMRFTPEVEPGKCNPWTVVFTHLSGGRLKMAVDPDSSVDYQQQFEVPMTRQG
jgi:transposase-like protein